MRVSRRSFVAGTFAGLVIGTTAKPQIEERRVYDPGSLLPPRAILDRSGIRTLSIRRGETGSEYRMAFASLEARVRAWDRFNSDPEWCALRELGEVRLREMRLDTV